MLGQLLGGFILVIVGVSLVPSISDSIVIATKGQGTGAGITNGTNLTGAAGTIISLTPLFFCLGIMASGIALMTSGLRNAGVM